MFAEQLASPHRHRAKSGRPSVRLDFVLDVRTDVGHAERHAPTAIEAASASHHGIGAHQASAMPVTASIMAARRTRR